MFNSLSAFQLNRMKHIEHFFSLMFIAREKKGPESEIADFFSQFLSQAQNTIPVLNPSAEARRRLPHTWVENYRTWKKLEKNAVSTHTLVDVFWFILCFTWLNIVDNQIVTKTRRDERIHDFNLLLYWSGAAAAAASITPLVQEISDRVQLEPSRL